MNEHFTDAISRCDCAFLSPPAGKNWATNAQSALCRLPTESKSNYNEIINELCPMTW